MCKIAVSNFVLTKSFGTKYVPKENIVVRNSRLKTRVYGYGNKVTSYCNRIHYFTQYIYFTQVIISMAHVLCNEM